MDAEKKKELNTRITMLAFKKTILEANSFKKECVKVNWKAKITFITTSNPMVFQRFHHRLNGNNVPYPQCLTNCQPVFVSS